MSRLTKEQRSQGAEYYQVLSRLEALRGELEDTYRRFAYLSGDAELETCILEITALKAKYNNYIRILKSLYFQEVDQCRPSQLP